MTEASLHSVSAVSTDIIGSDEDVSSAKIGAARATMQMAWVEKTSSTKKRNDKGKAATPRSSAKMADLQDLENKLSSLGIEIEERFSSLDGKFDKLLSLFEVHTGPSGEPENHSSTENDTSGVRRPQQTQGTNTSGVREPLISLENSLDRDYGINSHDTLSLQPGQKRARMYRACINIRG